MMTRLVRTPILISLLLASPPASAAERGFTITSFDRVRVEGPYRVIVATGRGASASASGDARALDALTVRVEGRLLIVRRGAGGWGGFPGEAQGRATLRVSTPAVSSASLAGDGALEIDRMSGARIDLVVEGAGKLSVGHVEADRLGIVVGGAGLMIVAGSAHDAQVLARGQGGLAAPGLTVSDADIRSEGAGNITLAATRTAKVIASGAGMVSVTGAPACTVTSLGASVVTCGNGE